LALVALVALPLMEVIAQQIIQDQLVALHFLEV
jgi:hypothetical protein